MFDLHVSHNDFYFKMEGVLVNQLTYIILIHKVFVEYFNLYYKLLINIVLRQKNDFKGCTAAA